MKDKPQKIKLTKEDLEKKCIHAIPVNYFNEQVVLCKLNKGKNVPMPVSEIFEYGFCEAMNSPYASYFIKIGISPKINLTKIDNCSEKWKYNSN